MIGDQLPIEGDLAGGPAVSLELGAQHANGARNGRPQRVVARRYRERDAAVRRFLAAADVLGVVVAMAIALLVLTHHQAGFLWGLALLPVWVLIFKTYGLYDRDLKRISHRTLDDLPWIFHAVLMGSLLLFAYYRLLNANGVELRHIASFGVIALVTISVARALARRASVSALSPEPVVLMGDAPELASLATKLETCSQYGVQPVGPISLSSSPEGPTVNGELDEAVERDGAERIVVAREDFEEDALFDLVCRAREHGVKVSVLPQLFDALGPSVEVDDVEGMTVLGVNPPVLPRSSRFLKRTMDVVGALTVLLLAAPLFAVIALAIKLDSRGPIFFRQERIGLWGRRFRLAKFRTMDVDAEERRAELLAESKDPGWLLLDEDPRVTRVGRFLRHWSLDELPQLWNVLKGEMSLVGPRPLIDSEDRQLEGWRRSRIDLVPGLTGLWQVLGRTSLPFEEMIRLDYLYVTNWSLWTDIRLMLRTVPAVVLRRGVN
ncbi:MAG TPA: sugar transferase [Solirubrobacterales bacterium]|jgi:exopolysaccharide biosynthesis polyprenyl glycosylphosphotransferase